MLHTTGIVFRSIKYGETSLIVDIYTLDKGLQTFIIGGVRKSKSKISPSLLQVMSQVELVSYFRESKAMHRIKDLRSAYLYQDISMDMIKSGLGLFMLEVAQKSIKEAESNPALFNFLKDSFQYLDETKNSLANLPLVYLLNLSGYLGFMPGGEAPDEDTIFDLQEGVFTKGIPEHTYYLNGEEANNWWNLMQLDLPSAHQITIEKRKRKFLLNQLILYYRLHIANFQEPKAHKILESLFQ